MISKENLENLIRPFMDQGADYVWAAVCCRRLFIGLHEPKTCSTCNQPPRAFKIEDPQNLDAAIQRLQTH